MKALILAGGRGNRLEEKTSNRNKCMLELDGKPLIEYSLENARIAGAEEITSPAFAKVLDRAERLATHVDENLLILGETGVGKEHLARLIHERSGRGKAPFVAVNVSAIPSEVFESELMGSVRGAFTDARDRPGRILEAAGGALFLDEIGDLSLGNQVKLLRFLETRCVHPVGGSSDREVDVRVVAATHRDLEAEVKAGRFREDLYYRLRVVELELPALRERAEDVPALAQRFLEQVAERLGREKKRLTDQALARLIRHPWPGNVRELRNVIEQATVLASGESIEEADLNLSGGLEGPAADAPDSPDLPFSDAKKRVVEDFERSFLLRALRDNDGNISRTAEAIGMVRQSLQQKIRELELRDEDWRKQA